jgi:hypothetical protein
MRDVMTILAVSTLVLAVACGGGEGSSDGGVINDSSQSRVVAASFTPDEPDPSDDSIAMSLVTGGVTNRVTVGVDVTGTDDVFGASFDVIYDSSSAQYVSWGRGSLLENHGQNVTYVVSEGVAGRLVVGISCIGCPSGVNVTDSRQLVELTFVVSEPGATSLRFANASLLDSAAPNPAPIPGLDWFGGTLTGN